ncbi:MAG: hypothetical protein HN368_14650, partial [Spirochaetales bacterium]|nr:hypothetical protein [Spirochaetales bacterium]
MATMKRKIAAIALMASTILLLTTCDKLFQVGLGDSVDITPPSLEILSPENGEYVSGAALLELTFSDDAGIATLEVFVGEDVTEAFDAISEFVEQGEDEVYPYEFDTISFDDGEIEVRLVVTDTAGKTVEKSLLVYIDNRPPTVLVNNPAGVDTQQFNDYITIRGEAADDAGISSVTVAVFDSLGTEIELFDSTGAATGTHIATAEGTNSWSYQFRSGFYTPTSEDYVFLVTATDRAGAQNSYFYYDDDVRTANGGDALTVEQLYRLDKPEVVVGLSVTPSALEVIRRTELPLQINQDLDLPVFDFSSPSVDNPVLGEGALAVGTIRDDDGILPGSIEIRFDSAAWEAVADTTGSGISVAWEYNLALLEEGAHTLELRATDINGRDAASSVINFTIDSGVPVVLFSKIAIGIDEITSGLQGSYLNDSFTLEGTVRDTVGVAAVDILIGDATDYISVTAFDIATFTEVDGTKEWAWSHDVTVAGDNSDDGTMQLRAKVTDTGGKTSSENLQVFIDTVVPVVTFLGISTGDIVNGDLLLQGTTQNVSPIESLALNIGGDTYTLSDTVNELDRDPGDTQDSTEFRWYKTADTTAYPDGPFAISMTALDAAGNTRIESLSLTIDQTSDIPVIFFDNVDEAGASTDNAFFGSASIIGRIIDDDAVDLATIEVRIDAGAWVPVTNKSGSGLSVNWEHVLTALPEGDHTFEITAMDISTPPVPVTSGVVDFLIDNGAPAVALTQIDVGARTIVSNFQGSYVNGNFTVSGTADDGFGVSAVDIDVNSTDIYLPVVEDTRSPDDTAVTWHYDVDTALMLDGTISLRIRGSDNTGKVAYSDVELVLDSI